MGPTCPVATVFEVVAEMSSKAVIIFVCIALVVLIIPGLAASIYIRGIQDERTKALTKGVELVKERDELNVQVRTATPADICRRLDGKWVPESNECS